LYRILCFRFFFFFFLWIPVYFINIVVCVARKGHHGASIESKRDAMQELGGNCEEIGFDFLRPFISATESTRWHGTAQHSTFYAKLLKKCCFLLSHDLITKMPLVNSNGLFSLFYWDSIFHNNTWLLYFGFVK
jgi:hypothetical protein